MRLTGGHVESHGGYLCQYEDVDAQWLHLLARQALLIDGQSPDDAALLVTVMGGPRIARFAWDGTFTYGKAGASWYLTHHTLARRLSEELGLTVHAYAFDPDEEEQVTTYADGRRVGGESLRYEEAEWPDSEDVLTFEHVQSRWPLGHLARVLGVRRQELLRIPRQATAYLDLSRPMSSKPLWTLFPEGVQALRNHELYAHR